MNADEWWEPNLERWAERGMHYKGPARVWLRSAKPSKGRRMVGLGLVEEDGRLAMYAVDDHFWRRCEEQPPRPTAWLVRLFGGQLTEALYERYGS